MTSRVSVCLLQGTQAEKVELTGKVRLQRRKKQSVEDAGAGGADGDREQEDRMRQLKRQVIGEGGRVG